MPDLTYIASSLPAAYSFDARVPNHPGFPGFSLTRNRLKTERHFSILRGLSAKKA